MEEVVLEGFAKAPFLAPIVELLRLLLIVWIGSLVVFTVGLIGIELLNGLHGGRS